ncbi:DNA sulfur modification protein DndB [Colwellia sp. 12G3]|uniref:DNA sulfur modification protein DndB n=1 Tax=Colwellia sp. 12G3 TaxID=2058299 RepID=UPI0012FEA084|nr:DNA sulfur modification protein DndB [Colwellia sp. 12G3]
MTQPKIKKNKKKVTPQQSQKSYDFSILYSYHNSKFGMKNNKVDEEVNVNVLNINVGNLLQDFKIFEDLNNVHSWPISTLIQRELDHDRANLIARDYLLKDSSTKYFPSLIAVLIPIGDDYKPLDKYGTINPNELKTIQSKFINGEDYYDNFGECKGLAEGVTLVPFSEEEGSIVWDKNTVSAVIIDGQHRYKALEKALERDKAFDEFRISITLIDLTSICNKNSLSPTDVSRDLFVTINNTPEEIDETRIVLMDDKDVLSTFTQVLIDDSSKDYPPSVPPMLIDWACDGAKHNSTNSLTGVLVIRQIILSAMFDDSKISTVDDRTLVKNVRKWKSKIDSWLSPDPIIEKELGPDETLEHRFKLAEGQQQDELDDDEEESIFLFSYSTSVSKLLKERFKSLFLPTFREVFSELTPYNRIQQLAKDHGVLREDKPLNNYYRSFKGKRESLKRTAELNKAIKLYEKDFSIITTKSIPHTVMGQKAIFKALFDGFLSSSEDVSCDDYSELTEVFISSFNEVYEILCPSNNADENFFLIDYKLKSNRTIKAKSIGSEFWKGIIIKNNGEIDYSKAAISILSQIIQDIVFYHIDKNTDDEETEFSFTDSQKLVTRHLRLIRKLEFEIDPGEDELQSIAQKAVNNKEIYLNKIFKDL